MKKMLFLMLVITMLFSLAACGDNAEQAQFNDTIELLPQEISMTRGRERVYYGSINNDYLDYNEEDIVTEAISGDSFRIENENNNLDKWKLIHRKDYNYETQTQFFNNLHATCTYSRYDRLWKPGFR